MLHGGTICAAGPALQRLLLEVLAEVRGDQGARERWRPVRVRGDAKSSR